jgi:Zn-dependent peptidase ImmA (M78 family)
VPSIRVDVAPSVLDWISNSTSFDGVDEKLLSRFRRWKTGDEQPTYAQIERLSTKIHIPFGYFLLKTPPNENLPLFEFRTLNSTPALRPSRNLMDTYYQMAAIQDWMRDYRIDQGNEQLSFVGICGHERCLDYRPASGIAASIRKLAALDEDWFLHSASTVNSFTFLRHQFENTGVLILKSGIVGQNTRRPLNVKEFRAFTLIDKYAPLVFINSKDSPSGQLFSLAHEIAHIWLGLSRLYSGNSDVTDVTSLETLCNAVAAELLVPMRFFIDEWERHGQLSLHDRIDVLVKHYKCGGAVIARRAFDNRFIGRQDYQEIIEYLQGRYENSKAKRGGGNYYDNAKSRFGEPLIAALNNSVNEGKTLYTEAFRLTGTNRITFAKLASQIGRHREQ